ncbi:unnamed protein product, partial [Rangifer tarandus platyrhynchus]
VWFKRRRTKWRKCRRALRIRDAPALRLAHPVVSNWVDPATPPSFRSRSGSGSFWSRCPWSRCPCRPCPPC